MSAEDTAGDAARIRERIAELDAERAALTRELVQRWDNTRTGKSGYQPACANEWKPGVCEKPRIKCGEDGLASCRRPGSGHSRRAGGLDTGSW